jgi:hypothetical protein
MRRAIEKDPLSLIVDLMKQQGEAAGAKRSLSLLPRVITRTGLNKRISLSSGPQRYFAVSVKLIGP